MNPDIKREPNDRLSNNDEKNRQARIRAASQLANDAHNPCVKESRMSLQCLDENEYDHDKCKVYFQNYRNCLNFWKRVQRDRTQRGISPALPPVEERGAVREEYYNKWAYKSP